MLNAILNFTADNTFVAMLMLGGVMYATHIALILLATIWALIWQWIDEAPQREANPYLNMLSNKFYKKPYNKLDRCSQREGLLISRYHWMIALSPAVIFLALKFINVTMILIISYALACTARSGRRLQKKVTSHINDKSVHLKGDEA